MPFSTDNKNFQSQLNYEVKIHRLPHVTFNLNRVVLPGLELAPVAIPTVVNKHFVPGDELQYSPLEIEFKVQEGMEDWFEIFQWMVSLAGAETHTQYAEIRRGRLKKLSGQPQLAQQTSENPSPPLVNLFTDITVFVLTSKENPYLEATFKNAWPSSLSSATFNSVDPNVKHLSSAVRFQYDTYNIKKL